MILSESGVTAGIKYTVQTTVYKNIDVIDTYVTMEADHHTLAEIIQAVKEIEVIASILEKAALQIKK